MKTTKSSFALAPADVTALGGYLPDSAYYYDGSLFVPSDRAAEVEALIANLAEHRHALLRAYAPTRRWRAEVGGITVAGVPIATDDRSKMMIMGTRIVASETPGFSTPWIAADGSVHLLSASEVIAISDAVLAHVAQCFAVYVAVSAAIDAGEIVDVAGVDAAPWPA